MKNGCLGWIPKKCGISTSAFHPGKVSHWNYENSHFFSFPFLSNIRGVVLGALHVSDSMPKGAEDPGIQTDQNCYVLLGSSGFIYKSLKTIIRPLVPSRKHSQENARMIKRNIWRYLNQIFLQEVLIKRWERAIYQLGLLFKSHLNTQ